MSIGMSRIAWLVQEDFITADQHSKTSWFPPMSMKVALPERNRMVNDPKLPQVS